MSVYYGKTSGTKRMWRASVKDHVTGKWKVKSFKTEAEARKWERENKNKHKAKYHFVYLAFLRSGSGTIKIGKSTYISDRIATLQRRKSARFDLAGFIKCRTIEEAYELEAYWHAEAQGRNLAGTEWHRFRPGLVSKFLGYRNAVICLPSPRRGDS